MLFPIFNGVLHFKIYELYYVIYPYMHRKISLGLVCVLVYGPFHVYFVKRICVCLPFHAYFKCVHCMHFAYEFCKNSKSHYLHRHTNCHHTKLKYKKKKEELLVLAIVHSHQHKFKSMCSCVYVSASFWNIH